MADKRGGFTKSQWEDLIRRLNDPKDPAGNYTTPGGGGTIDMRKIWPKVKKKDEDDLKIASSKRRKK